MNFFDFDKNKKKNQQFAKQLKKTPEYTEFD